MLEERKAEVLRALVEEHIRTGQPVSSGAVLDRSGLAVSSATVRNDLAALEADGFVMQPHTSAGRVPTDQAYRYYVDHLSPVKLRLETRGRVERFFSDVQHELGRLLQSTSDFLAELAHYPAVVVGPGLQGERLSGIHLVRLGPQVALVVVVTDAGRVSQELIRLRSPSEQADLEMAERYLGERLLGMTPAAGSQAVVDEGDLGVPVTELVEVALEAVSRSEHVSRRAYLGGTGRMASLWDDLGELHRVLEVLGQQALLLGMLEAATERVDIRIGSELAMGEPVDLSVVSTAYDIGGRPAGRVGVLGPMRMDYRRAISVVEEVSEGLAESLGS